MKAKIKILYFDNSENNRKLVIKQFENYYNKFQISIVLNKNDFENDLKNNKYDIILVGLNSFRTCVYDVNDYLKLKKQDIPTVVIIDSECDELDFDLIKKYGILDYYVNNSLNMEKLPDIINNVIEKHKNLVLKRDDEKVPLTIEKYKMVFDLFPIGIIISDMEGNIIECNKISEELLGITKDDLKKRKINGEEWKIIRRDGTIMPHEEFACVRALKEKIVIKNAEMGVIKSNGEISWISVTAAPIQIAGYGVAMMYYDISEKVAAEKKLEVSEERLRLALDAMSESVYDWNFSDDYFYFSKKLLQILGYEQLYMKLDLNTFMKLIHPDDLKIVNDIIESYKNMNRNDHDTVIRMYANNFQLKWILWRGRVVKDSKKVIKRVIGSFIDFTDRIILEKDLLNTNRALQITSEINNTIITSENEEILLKKVCDILQNITGYPLIWIGYAIQDEVRSIIPVASSGRELDDLRKLLFTWGDTPYGNSPVGKAVKTRKYSLLRNVKHDSDYVLWLGDSLKNGYMSLISLPLCIDEQVIGVITLYSDEINGFSEDDINLFIEIADDISFGMKTIRLREKEKKLQKELFQSQKMEALGKLAGGIAHDFNNLLTIIIGNLELAKHNIKNEEKLSMYFERTLMATEKASSLTKKLLTFSRQEFISPKVLSLNDVVKDMEKLLHRVIGENIELIVNLEPNLKKIFVDPTHIDQVIMNLVVNAIDAMPNGGQLRISTKNITITKENISQFKKAKEGTYVVISVIDTGHGISNDIIDKIFEPFFTTKVNGKGTGLGLSVVDAIVNQNKGFIEVYSQQNIGTTFEIFFPIIDNGINEEKEEIQMDLDIQGEGKKILVLEDDFNINEMILNLLVSKGFNVYSAGNIKKATEILNKENGQFDLLFSDIVLPDGNGLEFYEKSLIKYPSLKVLFVSGYADNRVNWYDIKQKGYEFIPKPFKINDIYQKIINIIFK